MPKLPILSGRTIIEILIKNGFNVVRQKGSHVSLQKKSEDQIFNVIVPLHDELAKGTLMSIIRQAGLKKDDLL